jgi:hypothetical protein
VSHYFLTNEGRDRHTYQDGSQVPTNLGKKAVETIYGSTKAFLHLHGQGGAANASVTYLAVHGGAWANTKITVEHTSGQTGAGHEDRPLAISVSGYAISVTFATDEDGASVQPTANQVADAVNAHGEASQLVTASVSGDGEGQAILHAPNGLGGGRNDGCYLCICSGRYNVLVNTVEV